DRVDDLRAAGRVDHEEDREEQDGQDEVRRRAGEDHRDLLPGRLPPVGVAPESLLGLEQAPLGGTLRHARELRLLERGSERGQRQAEDRREEEQRPLRGDDHPTGAAAKRRASASASARSSRSRAGPPSTVARTCSTVAAMSRKPVRPSRKAPTATSFAALSAHGYVPPRTPASRASRSSGNASTSGGWNSSVSPPPRSSGGTGVGARSG